MDATGILFFLFCYINAVSGQHVNIATGATAGKAAGAAAGVPTTTSVSVSKPDCSPSLVCPAVKCLSPVTPPGHCCPVCLPGRYSFLNLFYQLKKLLA